MTPKRHPGCPCRAPQAKKSDQRSEALTGRERSSAGRKSERHIDLSSAEEMLADRRTAHISLHFVTFRYVGENL